MQEGRNRSSPKILMKVNYSDTLYNDRQNKTACVKEAKACLVIATGATSSTGLSEKPSRFIHELATLGIIEIISHPNNSSLHIRVVEYDKWMGVPDSDKQKRKPSTKSFTCSGMNSTASTQLPKENIAKAQREWKKLGDKEQQLAIDRIEEYYFHQTNINFLLHAASYLSNKAFLNEY